MIIATPDAPRDRLPFAFTPIGFFFLGMAAVGYTAADVFGALTYATVGLACLAAIVVAAVLSPDDRSVDIARIVRQGKMVIPIIRRLCMFFE